MQLSRVTVCMLTVPQFQLFVSADSRPAPVSLPAPYNVLRSMSSANGTVLPSRALPDVTHVSSFMASPVAANLGPRSLGTSGSAVWNEMELDPTLCEFRQLLKKTALF